MPQISAVIITLNEEKYIGRCLDSLKGVADEIIVVDSYSSDATAAICERSGVRFIRHQFAGYVEQKNYALTQAKYSHILSVDADEALSDELRDSILRVKEDFSCDGYMMSRHDNYCGRWLKHSRHNPGRHMRLFLRGKGTWKGPNPHDRFVLEPGSRKKRLKGVLLHWNYETKEEHLEKMKSFSSISAAELFKSGRRAGMFTALFHMCWSFFRTYFLGAGFLDGYLGYVNSSIRAQASFSKYHKLRILNTKSGALSDV
jgi:glycosyltransferase involved in cell wall biosynthesis